MFTLNFFSPYILVLHKLSFSCSPIDKKRLKAELLKFDYYNEHQKPPIHREKLFIETLQHESYLLWSLRHPIQVIRLIKRYHMVGNATITLHLFLSSILIHLLIKSLIFIYAGDDKLVLEYFESIYYPHTGGLSRNPTDFNTFNLGFILLFLSFRFRSFCKLIKQAIVNANGYKELHVPQLNLAYMTTFNFTLNQWLNLWKHASSHTKAIKNDKEKYKNHLKFDQQIYTQLSKCHTKHLVYYHNLIDFEECYADLEFIKGQERQLKEYRDWHTTYPIDRISLVDLRIIVSLLVFCSYSSIGGLFICFISFGYRDLSSPYPRDYMPTMGDLMRNIPKHCTSLIHLIRGFEVCFLFSCQLPQIYESIKVAFDVHLTTSRADKIVDIFRAHLKYCQRRTNSINLIKIYDKNLSNLSFSANHSNRSLSYESQREFRERILRDIGLARLVYLEFLNLKKNHTTFLNMLVLGSGICMSYTVSLAIIYIDAVELILLLLTFISCLLPMIINLIFCARVEKTVSRQNEHFQTYLSFLNQHN